MSETHSDGFWGAEAREAVEGWLTEQLPRTFKSARVTRRLAAKKILTVLTPFVERMIEDARVRATRTVKEALLSDEAVEVAARAFADKDYGGWPGEVTTGPGIHEDRLYYMEAGRNAAAALAATLDAEDGA